MGGRYMSTPISVDRLLIDAQTALRVFRSLGVYGDARTAMLIGRGRRWDVYRIEAAIPLQRPSNGYYDGPMITKWTVRIRSDDGVKDGDPTPSTGQLYYGPVDDYRLSVHRYVHGESIEDRYTNHPELLAKEGVPFGYLPSLVARLRETHKVGDPNRPFAARLWFSALWEQCYLDQQYFTLHGIGLGVNIWRTGSTFPHLEPMLEPNPTSLLHGDLSNRNIILGPDSLEVSLIDWDASMYGDYMYDLANWGTFNDGHPEQYEPMMRLYHGLGEGEVVSPALWRRFWIYHVLISVSKLAHLHRLGYKDLSRAIERVRTGVSHL